MNFYVNIAYDFRLPFRSLGLPQSIAVVRSRRRKGGLIPGSAPCFEPP